MTRVRTDNVFGVVDDNPLLIGATTMNSAGLANLAAVSSAEAIIVLDPNRVSGAPEIVVVTAHTGSATSATIVRGQFGTTAREHALGTEWVHGPIASNATSYATAADDQGDFVPMNAWAAYTPTNTNVTVGNGTQVARFMRIGRTVHVTYSLLFGSTTAFTGTPLFGLPVAAADAAPRQSGMVGSSYALDSGTKEWGGVFRRTSASDVTPIINDALCSATAPFTWTTNDQIGFSFTYEAAS